MNRLKCSCGSESFKVNSRSPMVQCRACGSRMIWKSKWIKFSISKVAFCAELAGNFVVPAKKTIEFFESFMPKLRHPKKEKQVLKEFPFLKKIRVLTGNEKREFLKKRHLQEKWHNEITRLSFGFRIVYNPKTHMGKLRGKHIAKALHSDCKKLGIKTKLSFKGNNGIVEAV